MMPPDCIVTSGRELRRDEVEQVWNIDRSEMIENIYRVENGKLVLGPHHYNVPGWPAGEAEKYTPILLDCYDRGGWFHGAFDHTRMVGAVVLESKHIGKDHDQLQLKFLHVSNAYRKRGIGAELFELARATARDRGARRLYISATPSENTINFYLKLGCALAAERDPELFDLNPKTSILKPM